MHRSYAKSSAFLWARDSRIIISHNALKDSPDPVPARIPAFTHLNLVHRVNVSILVPWRRGQRLLVTVAFISETLGKNLFLPSC